MKNPACAVRCFRRCLEMQCLDSNGFGCLEYEASLLRLMDKISNGCKIEIDFTGALSLSAPSYFVFQI